MIIWINGSFGSGKTSVCNALHKKIENSYIFDPENVGFMIRDNIPNVLKLEDFQDFPIWRSINYDMLSTMSNLYQGIILVPMTIINKAYQREIFGRLRADGHEVIAFTLIADETTLRHRLHARGDGDNEWVNTRIEPCVNELKQDSYENKIDCNSKSIDTIVETILSQLNVSPINNTEYYDNNAEDFLQRTFELDMSQHYNAFEKYLKPGNLILDLGCGSGRDSVYFANKGYKMVSLDGSLEMVMHARQHLRSSVHHATFEDYSTAEKYDAIWASASLLHVERSKLPGILNKYLGCLKPGGVFFMSFKDYEFDFKTEDRAFTCFTKGNLEKFLEENINANILDVTESLSMRDGKMKWVRSIIQKEGDHLYE